MNDVTVVGSDGGGCEQQIPTQLAVAPMACCAPGRAVFGTGSADPAPTELLPQLDRA